MIYKFQTKDKHEAWMMLHSMDLYFALWDIDQHLRSEIKYNDKEEYEPIREELHDIMTGHKVDFNHIS